MAEKRFEVSLEDAVMGSVIGKSTNKVRSPSGVCVCGEMLIKVIFRVEETIGPVETYGGCTDASRGFG